jgi:anti-sigma-K factor RskA
LGLEPLTQLGVRFDRRLTRAEQAERLRQQRDTELENRQKAWKWLLVAAMGVLIVETAVAGRAARQIGQGP